jgi:hypothetical protein
MKFWDIRACYPSRFCYQFPVGSLEYDFLFGLESEIPICCVVEYCYRTHVMKQERIAAQLGIWGWPVNFVPCFFHREQIAAVLAREAYERSWKY